MEPRPQEEIIISLVHYPVYALGMGQRIGIWLQGCVIRCSGCISRHAWELGSGEKLTVSDLLTRIGPHSAACDGITISGGEPFDQPMALLALVRSLRERGISDIMAYSGYRFELLKERHPAILADLDALVDGEFRPGEETDLPWKGSENQRLIIMTRDRDLRARYEQYATTVAPMPRLQVVSQRGRVFVIGIPRQRDAEVILNGNG